MSHDLSALVPNTFRVVFPRTLDGIPQEASYAVDVTLSSLALSQYPTAFTGHDGTKTVRSSCTAIFTTAGGGTPTNNTELTNLANQLATDFYLWQLQRLDIVYADIVPYVPNGYADTIEWSYDHDTATTRVQRKPWREMEGMLAHLSGTSETTVEKCCGGTYVVGNTTYFTDNVVFEGDSVTINSNTTTTINGNTTFSNTSITTIEGNTTYTNTTTTTVEGNTTYTNTSNVTISTVFDYSTTTTNITANTNNLNIGTDTIVSLNPTGIYYLTGFVPKDDTKNEIRYIVNSNTTNHLLIVPNSGSSTATNRIYRKINDPFRLPPGDAVGFIYDSIIKLWRAISPPQPGVGYSYATTISGNTNNQIVQSANIISVTPSGGDRTLTGLDEVIRDGPFIIENADASNNLILANNSASSTSGNKFSIQGGDETITAGGMRTAIYDETAGVIKVIPASAGASSITITDGTTSQTVASGDTITFTANGEGVDLSVSATDTVTAKMDINGLSTATPNTTADYIVFYDATDSTHKKALANTISGSGSSTYNHVGYFLGVNTNVTTNTFATLTTITNTQFTTASSGVSGSAGVITWSQDWGNCIISLDATCYENGGSAGEIAIKLEANTGASWVAAAGDEMTISVAANTHTCSAMTVQKVISNGDKLRVRYQRNSGSSNMYLKANQMRLNIHSVN